MATPRSNITVNQGEDTTFQVFALDANNQPLSLNGYTAIAEMRKSPTTSTYFRFNVTIDAAHSTVNLNLTAANSWAIPAGRYHYDCFLTSSASQVTKLVSGIVTIVPGFSSNP